MTDLGDSAVTLPLAAFMLLYLLLSRWPRAAVALAVSLAVGGFAIALLKLALQSCGYRLLQTTLINPSGHVAMSTMVYGALAILLGAGLWGWRRWAVYGAFGLLIVARNLSRSTSACFFESRGSPLLGPTVRNFRMAFVAPSACRTSSQ